MVAAPGTTGPHRVTGNSSRRNSPFIPVTTRSQGVRPTRRRDPAVPDQAGHGPMIEDPATLAITDDTHWRQPVPWPGNN